MQGLGLISLNVQNATIHKPRGWYNRISNCGRPVLDRRAVWQYSTVLAVRAGKGEAGNLQVFVRDNNVDGALKALKKKMQREGIWREMKRHRSYEKPSERKVRKKAEAVRRARKLERKRLMAEGF